MRRTRLATGFLLVLAISACSTEPTRPGTSLADGPARPSETTTGTDTTTKADGGHMIGSGG